MTVLVDVTLGLEDDVDVADKDRETPVVSVPLLVRDKIDVTVVDTE